MPPASSDLNLEEQLAVTALSIEQSLRTLAEVQNQHIQNSHVLNTQELIKPESGLGEKISLDWSGPILPLLKKIGKMSDYTVRVLGKEPAIPIIVTLSASNVYMADVLKDAGLQAGSRAHVVVYPGPRVIELRYHNF